MKSSENILETRTVYTALRPPRVAIFVNEKDKYWKKTLTHIIEVISTIWGGDGFILIPTDGNSLHPYFEELLKIYDPDFVFTYIKTGEDLKAEDPDSFNKIVDEETKEWMKDNPDWDRESFRKEYEEQLRRSPYGPIAIGQSIKDFIKRELSVYHFRDDIQEQHIDYTGNLTYLLPKLTDVLIASDRLDNLRITRLDLSNFDEDVQIMGYGNTGIADLFLKKLNDERISLEELLTKAYRYDPEIVPELERKVNSLKRIQLAGSERFKKEEMDIALKSLWNRRIDLEGIDFRELWDSKFNKSKNKKTPPKTIDYFSRLPFPTTMIGLSYYSKRKDLFKSEYDNDLVIVGDSILDYCLYYSLTRLRRKVYWIPYSKLLKDARKPNYSTSYSSYLTNELRSGARNSEGQKIYWTSISITNTRQKNKVPDSFQKNEHIRSSSFGNIKDKFVFTERVSENLPSVLRVFEKGNANNYVAYQFINNDGVSFLDSPRPKSFDASDPVKHKWISEVNIDDYRYPTADFLSSKVFQSDSVGSMHMTTSATRVSSNGIHYQCPAMGFISSGEEVGDRLVKPKLKIIDGYEIFKDYFARGEYEIRPSDKGGYFLQVLKYFKNLDDFSTLLKNKGAFALFDLYQMELNRNGVFNEGVYLNADEMRGDKRRYVDFASIENLLSTIYPTSAKQESINLIDNLIDKELLERGYILKCNLCKNASWYKPSEIDRSFKCKRCSSENLIREENLSLQEESTRHEPIIYYKQNELFYQFWKNNGYITALTLKKLKDNSDGSIIFLPETEFRKNPNSARPDFEIDILAIVNGNLYIGEAKKDANSSNQDNKLKTEQIQRIIDFSNYIPLKGCVFTSWSGNWPIDVNQKFVDIEKDSKIDLIKFSKNDLI